MKILYIASDTNLSYNQVGGAGTHMRATIQYLEKDHQVIQAIGGDLIARNHGIQEKNTISRQKTWKSHIPNFIKYLFQDFRIIQRDRDVLVKTEELIKEYRPDVIYERSCYGYSTGYKLAGKYNIPRCMETDVLMFELKRGATSFLFNRLFYFYLEKIKFSTADAITVQSEFSIELCKKYWKIKHDRVFNKDLGIDLNKISLDSDISSFEDRYELKDKFVIAFVGLFQKYQKVHLLLEAAEHLKDVPEICFVIAGAGWKYEELTSEINKKNLKNILFIGKLPPEKVYQIYRRMDLGIIPDCAYHMYPVKYLEYCSYKKATLVPRYQVFNRFFPSEDDFNNFSFVPGNVNNMAEKILKLKGQNLYRTTIAEHLCEYVKTNHTWDICGKHVEQALIESINFKKSK